MAVDLFSQEYLRNPAAKLEELRSQGSVVRVRFPVIGKVWATTTQQLADRVLKDNATFTQRRDDGGVVGLKWWMPSIIRTITNSMALKDEPDHRRLRVIVDEAFRRRAVLDMEPRILAMAEEFADKLFVAGSPADLVERYAQQLPLAVICELLGLPLADRPKFTKWAGGVTRLTGILSFLAAIPNFTAVNRYLRGYLASVREQGGEGLVAELLRVEKEGGRISLDEMVSMLFLLLFAGIETTTHLIGGAVYELLRSPGLRDWLAEDWSRANLAVEEFLRFVTPVQFAQVRFVRKDVDLDGVRLRKGDKVSPMLAAANFDPRANEHPEKLDLARKPNRHIAFGTGIHFCLGHQLARIEAICALKALFRRWPKLALATDESQIRWRKSPGLRAIERLPVTATG
ncbi:MAG: cytochrome P450 [Methylobacteriaceae bacterium]|nr:cytochrome P450 [Methylobacteriaceae bacterium]MBV9245947.1 cytochrome P450 [Methylobacteriaceae bacterium]MBV9634536.1 cytochrome P450 [Methylobacteriaceae bacterium]MBV9704420.1 cytochrome P450 [Methylobacteriaceae bacterium]